ncbi:MAG TPA: helix-hairpin-helix domain-containing protein [Stellaceae bacterium]|nr:helix-hairpin-helix domain-containing protein [Stellaceae bacterium]
MKLGRYLTVAALSLLLAAPAFAREAKPSAATSSPATTAPGATNPAQGGLIDINTATAAELDKLPGIGTARAQAIIANRPYKGKDDLVQRKIVPQNVYNEIKDKIVARQGSAKPSVGSTTTPPPARSTTGK